MVTEYIPSGRNPADPLSQGIYPPTHLKLPALPIPHALQPFIKNATGDWPSAPLPSSPGVMTGSSHHGHAEGFFPHRYSRFDLY